LEVSGRREVKEIKPYCPFDLSAVIQGRSDQFIAAKIPHLLQDFPYPCIIQVKLWVQALFLNLIISPSPCDLYRILILTRWYSGYLVSFLCMFIPQLDQLMKKIMENVDYNICSLLGNAATEGRPLSFKIVVGTLVMTVTTFILVNILKIAF
jgi:hypothetical protein